MKRLAVLAFLLLAALPGAAQAQYAMGLDELKVAIQLGDFNGDVERLGSVVHVYVERVSGMAGIRIGQPGLDAVLARRTRVLAGLRAVVRQNQQAMKALAIHHEALEDVIWMTTTNDGGATLYVDDR